MPGQRILIIKLGALGDFIQALGPMAAIRAHHKKDHITLLTTAPFAGLGSACGYFDEVWVDSRPRWSDVRGWRALRQKFAKGAFSRVYDLQNNDRTSFYLHLFPRRQRPAWVGAARGASHRNTAKERTAGQAFDGHVQTLALAGIGDVRLDDLGWVKGDAGKFGLSGPYVLLVPGSAPQHPYKRWPVSCYGELAGILEKRGCRSVILGTADEAGLAAGIKNLNPGCIDLTGRTALTDIVLLARGAVASVGNDTGPMHLIAPTGCPSCILFSGASSPVRHAPKGPAVICLQEKDLENLSPESVASALLALMSDNRNIRDPAGTHHTAI